jgi:hypothetical protein
MGSPLLRRRKALLRASTPAQNPFLRGYYDSKWSRSGLPDRSDKYCDFRCLPRNDQADGSVRSQTRVLDDRGNVWTVHDLVRMKCYASTESDKKHRHVKVGADSTLRRSIGCASALSPSDDFHEVRSSSCAKQIGAQLDFWSGAGAGTEVELTVPASVAYETSRNDHGFKLFRKARNHEHRS